VVLGDLRGRLVRAEQQVGYNGGDADSKDHYGE
jgi:hypothetical protein